MRRLFRVALPAVAGMSLLAATVFAHRGHSETRVTIYDANPEHQWNRLHDALFVRQDRSGTWYGQDSLDPLLWGSSTHLLEPKSHRRAIEILDKFLENHAEKLLQDPVKRAILQRDLWAVFDWSVARQPDRPGEPAYEAERRELQIRVAEVMRRLALTPKEMESLPDNYSQAVASGEFATSYDPEHRERPFLPADLLDPHGSWFEMEGWDPPYSSSRPAAIQHVSFFSGRSRFLILVRLPGGRKATLAYFRQLWNFPEPWITRDDAPDQMDLNSALPSFPAGTQVALVRQMELFDNQGNLVSAPITESVQIRVYRSVTAHNSPLEGGFEDAVQRSGQDCYEFRLSRPQLFAGKSGGLRAVGRDEKDFLIFNAHDDDQLDEGPIQWNRMPAVTQECVMCHRGVGIASLNSRHNLVRPGASPRDPGDAYPPLWWQNDGTVEWKQERYDWGLLSGYWKASARGQ